VKPAAIYARVSSDKQKEEHTIASQTEALRGFPNGPVPTLTWTITADCAESVLRFTHGGWKSASDFFAMCKLDVG